MHLGKQYWIAIICKFAMIATSFLITIFINRGLGVSGKGEYAYVTKLVEMLYIFCSIGIGQAYATYRRSIGESVRSTFFSLAFFHVIIVLLIGMPIVLLSGVDYGIAIVSLTAVAVANVIISMMAVIENSIRRNIIVTSVNILYLAVLCVLYYTGGLTLTAALICYGLNEVFAIIVILFTYRMKFSIKHLFESAKSGLLKNVYKTGLITMIVVLLISINYSVDTIMLKRMSDSYYTGIYSVGAALSNMFLLIPDAFKEVLFGDSTKKSFNKKTAYSSIKVSLLALGLILIAFVFLGKFAIQLFYGTDYLPSYEVTLVLFIGSISMVFFKILQPVYIAYGKQTKAAVFLALSAIINVAINAIMIPTYHSMGAAVASAISYSICGLLFFIDYIRTKDM